MHDPAITNIVGPLHAWLAAHAMVFGSISWTLLAAGFALAYFVRPSTGIKVGFCGLLVVVPVAMPLFLRIFDVTIPASPDAGEIVVITIFAVAGGLFFLSQIGTRSSRRVPAPVGSGIDKDPRP